MQIGILLGDMRSPPKSDKRGKYKKAERKN